MSNDMKDFEDVKPVRGASNKRTPIVKITTAIDTYLEGILLTNKELEDKQDLDEQGQPKKKLVSTFKLVATNAPMIAKGAQGYAPITTVKAGDEVSIYGAPTRLANALRAIEPNGKFHVKIVYDGKKTELVNGRKVHPHTFRVGKRAVAAVATNDGVPD